MVAERRGRHVRLLILQADVQGQDEGVLYTFRHVRVSCAMIEHESAHELRLVCCSMLHLHDLNHVQVYRLAVLVLRVYITDD